MSLTPPSLYQGNSKGLFKEIVAKELIAYRPLLLRSFCRLLMSGSFLEEARRNAKRMREEYAAAGQSAAAPAANSSNAAAQQQQQPLQQPSSGSTDELTDKQQEELVSFINTLNKDQCEQHYQALGGTDTLTGNVAAKRLRLAILGVNVGAAGFAPTLTIPPA